MNDTFRGQLVLRDGSVRSAIIKDLDQRQLGNELMAAALANAAGVPVPQAHLAVASQAALAATKGPALADGSRLVFASQDAQTPPVTQLYVGGGQDAVRRRLADWDGIGGVYGFDTWIANVDRHEGNLLFSGNKEVWLIDHGHCFTGPQWKPADFDPQREYPNRLKEWLTPAMSDSRRAAVASVAAMTQERVKDLNLNMIGDLNCILDFIDKGDFAALVGFLKGRCSYVPRLAAAALNINLAV